MTLLPDWRRVAAPAARGLLRERPEDFRVTELLDIDWSNDGEHDWLWLEKREANTAWVARQLARIAGVAARDVGYAGLKDRHAVTRQWFSVRRPSGAQHDWQALELPGVTLLEARRHRRKLKRGAHAGNKFELVITNLDGDPAAAAARVREEGVPNYFGEQRFGIHGRNLQQAARLFEGARLPREQRGMALSAARAFLFNEVLDRRIADASWNRLQDGDIAILDGSNSHFPVPAVDATLAARCEAFDLHPSGPLWGRGGAPWPPPDAAVAGAHPETAAGLERLAAAARRSLRLRPACMDWSVSGNALQIAFELPAGAFATAVLREIVSYEDAAESRRSST